MLCRNEHSVNIWISIKRIVYHLVHCILLDLCESSFSSQETNFIHFWIHSAWPNTGRRYSVYFWWINEQASGPCSQGDSSLEKQNCPRKRSPRRYWILCFWPGSHRSTYTKKVRMQKWRWADLVPTCGVGRKQIHCSWRAKEKDPWIGAEDPLLHLNCGQFPLWSSSSVISI